MEMRAVECHGGQNRRILTGMISFITVRKSGVPAIPHATISSDSTKITTADWSSFLIYALLLLFHIWILPHSERGQDAGVDVAHKGAQRKCKTDQRRKGRSNQCHKILFNFVRAGLDIGGELTSG